VGKQRYLESISSTFYVRIFRTNVVFAAFSSYGLALVKNLYEKRARLMLMKLTADCGCFFIIRCILILGCQKKLLIKT